MEATIPEQVTHPGGRPSLHEDGSKRLCIRLPIPMYQALNDLATARGLDLSVLIRWAIHQQLVPDRRSASR